MADTIVGAHREPPQAPNQEVGLNCCRSHHSKTTLKPSRTFLATRESERQRKERTGPRKKCAQHRKKRENCDMSHRKEKAQGTREQGRRVYNS